jgi:hypothetical protein
MCDSPTPPGPGRRGDSLQATALGQPKIPKAIQSMLDRGLVRIGTNPMGRLAAFFTDAGLEGLRQLLRESRAMDPARYGYLRRELGMDDLPDSKG